MSGVRITSSAASGRAGPLRSATGGLSSMIARTPLTVLVALCALAALLVLAVFAPLLATHDWSQQQLLSRLSAPGGFGPEARHILGADHLGRDVFSQLLYALRTTLIISSLGVCIGVFVGATIGLVSGIVGGWVDNVVMLMVDANTAIPLTLLAMAAAAIVGSSPLMLVLIVGLADFGSYVRVVRAEVLSIRERPFVEAARSLGAPPARVAMLHILPNLVSPIIVLATINFSHVVILESALSFLGVGVQPPNTSLGQMVGDGRNYLISHWWLAAIPAAMIAVITMTVSTLGDWLRDLLDPDQNR